MWLKTPKLWYNVIICLLLAASSAFDDQMRKGYQEWLTNIETNHPGKTWDGLRLAPEPTADPPK